jgi:hypothetical protein
MIPPPLVTSISNIRKKFLQTMEQLDQTASFKALLSGSETLRGEWDELQKIAHSPRLARECTPQFTCAIVGSSSHGKTSILSEMFPSLTQRGWLVTDVTDTTSQALVIRRAEPGNGSGEEVVVQSWNLEQIKRLVQAAADENARLHIQVAYRPDLIEIDGKDATFAPDERRHFRFELRQKLRSLARSYVLSRQESADKALIRALTVKESSDRVRTDPVLTVDGQPFHALQLRAAVKQVELRDPFQQLTAWAEQGPGELEGLVFIDTPGLNVQGSIKDEVLRAVLGRKNQQIIVELIRNDELDLIVHLVLAGQQSSFAQLWGPLNKACRPEDLDDLSERLVLAINGANILLTNPDILRKWDAAVAQQEGDPFSVVLESNILKKMSETGSFRPAKICFLDSSRIVETAFGRPYQDFYAAHRSHLEACIQPGGVGYETLQRLGLLESFRENIAALCNPGDRGQGFLVRQILSLIRERGPQLFVRKHLIRSRLARAVKKLREILTRHYDPSGRLSRRAVLEAVRYCWRDIDPDDPESVEIFYARHFQSEIDALVPGPGDEIDEQKWVNEAFKKLCQLLYSKAHPPNGELREVFKKYALDVMGQWRVRWGYKSAWLPAPTRQYPDSAELLRHALHLHIREMLYQMVSGDSGAADVHQDADDQKQVQSIAQSLEQIERLVEARCAENGVKP